MTWFYTLEEVRDAVGKMAVDEYVSGDASDINVSVKLKKYAKDVYLWSTGSDLSKYGGFNH